MDLLGWLKIVAHIAPLVLAATPLAPVAPFVAAGVQAAESVKGATGAQKLEIAKQIVNIGVAATNAQAGKVVVDPVAVDTMVKDGISAVVAATNVRVKGQSS